MSTSKRKQTKTTGEGEPTPKSRVEEMFGGVKQPTMKIKTEIPLPESADPDHTGPSARDIKDRVDAVFDSIGTETLPGTVYPTGGRNNGVEAAEFLVAEQLKKRAEKRYAKAKDAAAKAGVFGDGEYRPGETTMVYQTPDFVISVRKNEDSNMINREQVEDVLKEIAPKKWSEVLERCLKPRDGATQIITALK